MIIYLVMKTFMDSANEDQASPLQLRPSRGAGAACLMTEGRGDAESYII